MHTLVEGLNRVLRTKPVRYSHEAFHQQIEADPHDSVIRKVYADWLEDNAPHSVEPHTLEFLRNHEGPAWVYHSDAGQVTAGHQHSWEDLRRLNGEDFGWHQTPDRIGGHFWGFFPSFTEGPVGEQEPVGQPHSGPNGTHFVTRQDTDMYNVWRFDPKTNGISQVGRPAHTQEDAHYRAMSESRRT